LFVFVLVAARRARARRPARPPYWNSLE